MLPAPVSRCSAHTVWTPVCVYLSEQKQGARSQPGNDVAAGCAVTRGRESATHCMSVIQV